MADDNNSKGGGSEYFSGPAGKDYFLSDAAAKQLQQGYNHSHQAFVTKYVFGALVVFFITMGLACFALLVLSYQQETRQKVFDLIAAVL